MAPELEWSLLSQCEFTPLLNWLKGQRQKAALKFTEALVGMLKQKPLTPGHKEMVANNMALKAAITKCSVSHLQSGFICNF